jgi:predicted nucleic acid-binding Zn ribbon protein
VRRLSELLPTAMGHAEVLRAARAQSAMREWPTVVGPILADKTTPDRYDRGVLWVSATGSAWAQELRLGKDTVIERLNGLTPGERLFSDLKVSSRPPRRRGD